MPKHVAYVTSVADHKCNKSGVHSFCFLYVCTTHRHAQHETSKHPSICPSAAEKLNRKFITYGKRKLKHYLRPGGQIWSSNIITLNCSTVITTENAYKLPKQLDSPNIATAKIDLMINCTIILLALMTSYFFWKTLLYLRYNTRLTFGILLRLLIPIRMYARSETSHLCYNHFFTYAHYGYANALEYLNKYLMRQQVSPWCTVSFINIYTGLRTCLSFYLRFYSSFKNILGISKTSPWTMLDLHTKAALLEMHQLLSLSLETTDSTQMPPYSRYKSRNTNYRWFLYSVPERGSFITRQACVRQHISCKLTCLGLRQ